MQTLRFPEYLKRSNIITKLQIQSANFGQWVLKSNGYESEYSAVPLPHD